MWLSKQMMARLPRASRHFSPISSSSSTSSSMQVLCAGMLQGQQVRCMSYNRFRMKKPALNPWRKTRHKPNRKVRMRIILLESIPKLGNRGDVATVKRGYARNFLLPSGKAAYMTEENIAKYNVDVTQVEGGIRVLSPWAQAKDYLQHVRLLWKTAPSKQATTKLAEIITLSRVAEIIQQLAYFPFIHHSQLSLPGEKQIIDAYGEYEVQVNLLSGPELYRVEASENEDAGPFVVKLRVEAPIALEMQKDATEKEAAMKASN